MRSTSIRLVTTLRPSRELCGTTPAQFADLVQRLEPIWAAQQRVRLDRAAAANPRLRTRRRAGAGVKPMPFPTRLLIALTHLRLNTPQRTSAVILGVSQATVGRVVDEVTAALEVHGFYPPDAPGPIRTPSELAAYLQRPTQPPGEDPPAVPPACVDATEIPCPRPGDWGTQAPLYSGKRRDHTRKTTVITRTRRPAWVTGAPGGRTHDLRALTDQTDLLAAFADAEVDLTGDSAYQGLGHLLPGIVQTPAKRPRGRQLRLATKRANRTLASSRVRVEHAIGAMKRWRVLHYLRQRTAPERVIRATGVLASLL